jgi:hypothetical protein
MRELQTLEAMGLTRSGPAHIIGAVLFGIIGIGRIGTAGRPSFLFLNGSGSC